MINIISELKLYNFNEAKGIKILSAFLLNLEEKLRPNSTSFIELRENHFIIDQDLVDNCAQHIAKYQWLDILKILPTGMGSAFSKYKKEIFWFALVSGFVDVPDKSKFKKILISNFLPYFVEYEDHIMSYIITWAIKNIFPEEAFEISLKEFFDTDKLGKESLKNRLLKIGRVNPLELARSPFTNRNILEGLSRNPSVQVRKAVHDNKATPKELRIKLKKDTDVMMQIISSLYHEYKQGGIKKELFYDVVVAELNHLKVNVRERLNKKIFQTYPEMRYIIASTTTDKEFINKILNSNDMSNDVLLRALRNPVSTMTKKLKSKDIDAKWLVYNLLHSFKTEEILNIIYIKNRSVLKVISKNLGTETTAKLRTYEKVFIRLLSLDDSEINQSIAQNNYIPLNIFIKLSKLPDVNVRKQLAKNRNIPNSIIKVLSEDKSPDVKYSLLRNKEIDNYTFNKILDENFDEIIKFINFDTEVALLSRIINSERVSLKYLEFFSSHDDWVVRHAVAANPNTTSDILKSLVKDKTLDIRKKIASRSDLDDELMYILASDGESSIRSWVALKKNIPIYVAEMLSRDKNYEVLKNLENNPSVSDNIKAKVKDRLTYLRSFKKNFNATIGVVESKKNLSSQRKLELKSKEAEEPGELLPDIVTDSTTSSVHTQEIEERSKKALLLELFQLIAEVVNSRTKQEHKLNLPDEPSEFETYRLRNILNIFRQHAAQEIWFNRRYGLPGGHWHSPINSLILKKIGFHFFIAKEQRGVYRCKVIMANHKTYHFSLAPDLKPPENLWLDLLYTYVLCSISDMVRGCVPTRKAKMPGVKASGGEQKRSPQRERAKYLPRKWTTNYSGKADENNRTHSYGGGYVPWHFRRIKNNASEGARRKALLISGIVEIPSGFTYVSPHWRGKEHVDIKQRVITNQLTESFTLTFDKLIAS
ncbi:hypothetical protein L9W92_18345 [Pelotomaculum terephthalicicum JT]|uniref:hypothetical protein n=1 Tax=Pelotomaculum terephthalicicum TaxID=206393 RepID=UPI001F0441B5|nr:hypothetical protein [Pelotomaculum terephthalicicum]MCG9969957.1 hypothetical protein [Pelotomaculum terephthalicicum JT]